MQLDLRDLRDRLDPKETLVQLDRLVLKAKTECPGTLEFKAPLVAMAKLVEMVYRVYLESKAQKGRLGLKDRMVHRETMAQWDQKVRKALKVKLVCLVTMALKVPVAFKEFLDTKVPRLYLLRSEKVDLLHIHQQGWI